ncbi:MAG: AtpZ/AtpI family protein [Armatimonadota bacterium]
MPNGNQKWIRNAGLASTAGLVLVVSIVIGYFFGTWLDKKFGTEPYLMLLFTVLGIAAGFIELFRLVSQISQD